MVIIGSSPNLSQIVSSFDSFRRPTGSTLSRTYEKTDKSFNFDDIEFFLYNFSKNFIHVSIKLIRSGLNITIEGK